MYACHSCGHEMSGYSKHELGKKGWQWHLISGTKDAFVMCDHCEEDYAKRRKLSASLAEAR